MSARTTSAPSVEMQQARRRLARWRQTRKVGAPIPESLLGAAVKLTRRHGVYQTALSLGLEYNKLKRLSQSAGVMHSEPAAPKFVELIAPRLADVSGCGIELEGPQGGRVKIELPSADAPLLLELCRAAWSGVA